MSSKIIKGILAVAALVFLALPAIAQVNPNGFPSGPHWNLNIIGKKAGFVCPDPVYDEYGNQVYGNVVFVPESGKDIDIWMQSGKGTKAAAIPELQVTDWCTTAIDGDAAIIQLPKNDLGYYVYARPLAKPTDNPDMTITPGLVMVQDENSTDLIYLGLVNSAGFQTTSQPFTREKGQSKALDITGLFNWTGTVCYLTPTYCDSSCETKNLCCTDTTVPPDGILDSCVVMADGDVCGGVIQSGYCRSYTDAWVFNIADFVTYLWSINNDGVKLLQVRFYPRAQ